MEAVKTWLDKTGDYHTGIELYQIHGNNETLKKLFAEEWSAFKEKKLRQLLTDLVNAPVSEKIQAQKTVIRSPFNQYKHWPPLPIEDPVLLALHQQWKPLYSEMQSLQHRIYEVALQGEKDVNKHLEAGQMAHRVLDLDDQVEYIYAKRNFYYDNKRLPVELAQEAAPEITDPVKWAVELQNNERYVRRYSGKLRDNPGHKNADKWAMLLKEKQALVDKYKKLLKIE